MPPLLGPSQDQHASFLDYDPLGHRGPPVSQTLVPKNYDMLLRAARVPGGTDDTGPKEFFIRKVTAVIDLHQNKVEHAQCRGSIKDANLARAPRAAHSVGAIADNLENVLCTGLSP